MIRYVAIALALALAGAVLWGAQGQMAAQDARAALKAAEARAEAAETRASIARFNADVAVQAMQEAEQERAEIRSALEEWEKTYGDTLDERAPDALLDLIGGLRRDGDGGGSDAD